MGVEDEPRPAEEGLLSAQALRQLRATVREAPGQAPAAPSMLVGASGAAAGAGLARAGSAGARAPEGAPPGPADGAAPAAVHDAAPTGGQPAPAATGPAPPGRVPAAPVPAGASPTGGAPDDAAPAPSVLAAAAVQGSAAALEPLPDVVVADAAPGPAAEEAAGEAVAEAAPGPASAAAATARAAGTSDVPPPPEVDRAARIAGAGSGAEDGWIAIEASFATPDADGSERLRDDARIEGVPAGARLSLGREVAPGVWEVATADLLAGKVAILPPPDSDATIRLTLRVVAEDVDAGGFDRRELLGEAEIGIAARADAPRAGAAAAAGEEDRAIALDLSAALADTDGSERLSVAILGLPAGAALSAGTRNADGSWSVSPAELPGLSMSPPRDFSGRLDLTLRVTATEAANGDAATREVPFAVGIAPRAEADAALSAAGSGAEDGWIAIAARFATADADGSERLGEAVLVEGVPAGAALNRGVELSPGRWSVPRDALLAGEVALRPPADSDAAIGLTLTATLRDEAAGRADSRTLVAQARIEVAAVADAPDATLRGGAGIEDRAIALDLAAGLSDTDGSESLSLRLVGVPAGATLSAGTRDPDGGWILSASDLPGLSLTPPRDFAGEIALVLRATATEAANGDAATVERALTLHVAPEVDGATLAGSAAGGEDRAIPLDVVFGASSDASETWDPTALVRGVPAGARLSAGEDLGGGTWRVDRAALAAGDIAITPPADSHAPIALTIEAVLRDGEGGGATRSFTAGVTVAVAAIADAPQARAGDVSGEEDRAIALDLSAALSDTDGSEGLALAILGLPAGAALSAGTRNPDGSWTVTAAQLYGLALTPPRDFGGTLSLVLRATATEASNGDAATTERPFAVTVGPRADRVAMSAEGEGVEDGWVPIRGTVATTDADGSERLGAMLTVGDVPAGAVLSHGTETAPGIWSVPLDVFRAGSLAIRPPAQSDADIVLRLGVTAHDGDDRGETEGRVTLVVRAVADAPVVQVADAQRREDTPIRLAGLGGALVDTDGSETLAFVIAGLPSGATLSAGTRGADGSWTLTPAQLAGVSVVPPAQFSGSMALTLTAVATEARDGAPAARSTASFTVSVDPVADAGSIAGSVTGNEDGWIALRPTFATPDADGSETWSATTLVSAVPAGATLSRGTEVAPGEWQVETADLRAGRVSIRPPADSDADFRLTMRATLSDAGNGMVATREVTGSYAVAVRAVADAPGAAAANVAGEEDRAIALDLSAALADRDGSETLSLAIRGMPAGASLSAGTRNTDGSWSVTAADLPGLALTPPRDFAGEIALTLRATAREQRDGGSATTDRAFTVRVEAVADAPTLRTGPAIGAEDGAIALRVSAATTDVDGSERIAGFRILDLPDGAVLRAGGVALAREADGGVSVDAAAAATLNVTPPPDSDADFTLRVVAISVEPNGSRAEGTPRDLPVRVDAVADAPVWLRVGASGAEDAPIALDLAARLADADGSERLSYVISGVPDGAVLSAGAWRGPGSWSLTAEEAAGVTLTPPPDFSGTIELTASAVAQESDGGAQAVATVRFPLRVAAVVDTTDWSATARGSEDAAIALNLAPPLRDADGSERLVGEAVVEGVPAGAVLRLADGSAVATADGVARIAVERLEGLTLTMPRDSDVAARLGVRVTVQDADGSRAELRGSVTVDPAGVADRPALGVGEVRVDGHDSDDPARGWSSLPVKAALTDTDGSESLTVWLRDVPAGFLLSAGTPAGEGVWLLREADLPGLRFRPPAGFDDEVKLRVEAVAVEREGGEARNVASLLLRVDGVDDDDGEEKDDDDKDDDDKDDGAGKGLTAPELAVGTADGREDGALALPIKLGAAAEGTTQVVLVGELPDRARLSAGIRDPERDVWVLRPEELDGLRLIPPADFAGTIEPKVMAIAIGGTGASATASAAGLLRIEAVADGPAVSAAPAAAVEDQAIALNLGIAARDADGSESVVAITLSGLTAGARIAPAPGIRDNGDGSWSVEPSAVGAVRLVPPADAHGTIGLTVTATVREASNGATATASRGVSVAVAAVPDAPTIAVADAAGREDRPIALGLSAALADRDGSEALSLVIAGLPEGARLSAGINNGDGSWTLSPAQLSGLTVTPPGDWSGSMALTLHAHAMERGTGQVATSSLPFRVSVAGVADAPLLDAAAAAAGREDAAVALDILSRLTDTDRSEALTLVVTGVPAGAVFSAGHANPDGSWTIPGAALPGLTFTPPPDYAGTLRLDIAATATEADGDAAATRFQLAVTVDPVADAPLLTVTGATGAEDSAIRLPIAAALADADGSESIARFLVAGVPAGATLSAGTRGADGVWTLTPDQAATVSLRPPAHFSGSLSLTVSAVSREAANGAEAVTSAPFAVTVTPVADAPNVTAANATGTEDRAVALNLAVALLDKDGSESIAAITLAGLPAGFALSGGTPLGDGAWRLSGGDLAGLRLHAPADWNGTLALTLEATARDGASEATTSRGLAVTIAAENDAPVLTLSAAPAAAAGQDRAALVATSAIADVDSPRMGGATISLSGAGPGERLVLDGYAIREEAGRSLVGDTGIELARGPGTVTLTGAAPAAVYERVLASLAIEDPAGLGAGRRDIAVTLRDEGGAAAATRGPTVEVEPSVVTGGAADASLPGTAGHDSFHGGTGNETMTGGAGADLFVVAADGGRDSILGGDGSWIDTVRVEGAGAPGEGGWTLAIDPAIAVTRGERSFDFAQPMAASIHFADGTQVELAQIERITW